ncbi:serine protease, partial [Synechococcus sp. AH-551-C10]
MKRNGSRIAFTFQAAFIISSCLFSSSLRANERVAELAEKYTVRLEGATQGSGVLVKKEDKTFTVLTSWHVVKDQNIGEELDIYTQDGTRHSAQAGTIKRIGNIDMAIVKFNSDGQYSIPTINPNAKVRAGSQVYVTGFPLPSTAVPRRLLRFTTGNVIANADIFIPKGYQLLYSNTTYPGMSGGSVLNEDGHLVGIHGQGEIDSMQTQTQGIAIKTGTNQAVPIRYYLEKQGLIAKTISENSSTDNVPRVFENLIVESKSLISKYEDGLEQLDGDYALSTEFVRNNQQYLDLAISKAEKALTISRTPEAHLLAGTAYTYKKSAHFHVNHTSA